MLVSCILLPILGYSYCTPNSVQERCADSRGFTNSSKRLLKRLSLTSMNGGRLPQVFLVAREVIQWFSHAGIHGGGRDLRISWEEGASLASELGSTASDRWGANTCFRQCCAVVSLRACPDMEEDFGRKHLLIPLSCVSCQATWSTQWLCDVFCWCYVLTNIAAVCTGLILGALKESTLGKILWEDT